MTRLVPRWRALIAVFVSGAAVMASEMVAGRLVAPFFGQSIRTWTALTGVTLLGCTLGNAIGALLSRRSPRTVATVAFALGGLVVGSVPFVLPLVSSFGLVPAVALAWLAPSVLLGCVTPSAAAAAVRADRNGSDLSCLYVFSMAGSLLGAGLGGLVLPFVLPADTLYFALGAILLLSSPLAFSFSSPSPAQGTDCEAIADRPTHKAHSTNIALAVFAVGYLGMAAEMAASKLVIPILGGNHIVWAFIILSFIGWMAAGGSLGGRVADRFPHLATVVLSLCLAAFGICATTLLETRVFTLPAIEGLEVSARLVLQIVLGFCPVAFALGFASTVLLKFATAEALASGDRAAPGFFYALASAGSVAGTFVTGLWCTGRIPGFALMGVLAVAAVAVALRLAWGDAALRLLAGLCLAAVFGVSCCAHRPVPTDIVLSGELPVFSRESNYNAVNVTVRREHEEVRTIWLDRIAHTTVDQRHPERLSASYTLMIDSVIQTLHQAQGTRHEAQSIFMIGGGGYSLPLKWTTDKAPPGRVVVAEIDPVVKEAAFAYLKPRDVDYPAAWEFPVGDGRMLAEDYPAGSFDVVIGDTIADTAIPYHLVTAEFTARLKGLLKTGGVYLLHVLDEPGRPDLTATLAATLRTSFAQVSGFCSTGLWDKRQSIVLVASDDPAKVDVPAFLAELKRRYPASYPHAVDLSRATEPPRPLTDRFAPVERWVWRTITRAMETRATRLARQALDARNENDMPRCRELAVKALAIDPDHVWAVEGLADWLEEHRDDAEARRLLERIAARENPDPYAKRRLADLKFQ